MNAARCDEVDYIQFFGGGVGRFHLYRGGALSTGSAGSPGPRCFRPPAETTASRHGGAVARWAHPLGHSPTPCRIRMIVTRRAVIPMPIMPAEAGTWKLFQQPSVRRRPLPSPI